MLQLFDSYEANNEDCVNDKHLWTRASKAILMDMK